MKKKIIVLLAMIVLSLNAFALNLVYEKTITTVNQPYPLAVNSSGGLFYATFDAANSKVYYIADPVNAQDIETSITHSSFTNFPAGRGLQGLAVDSVGNLFVSGDFGGGLNSSAFEKFNPPNFTEDLTFNPDMTGVRILGCAAYPGNYVLVVSFGGLRFYDGVDGSYDQGIYVDAQSYYQHDVAVNTGNYDIYTARNGDNRLGSVILWSGGSPGNLAGYTRITLTFINNIAPVSQLGWATQGVGYYAQRNLLFISNKGAIVPDNQGTLDIYSITGTGASATATLETVITGSESGTPLGESVDAVMFEYPDGERLFVSDYDNDRILVYIVSTAVSGSWKIYY